MQCMITDSTVSPRKGTPPARRLPGLLFMKLSVVLFSVCWLQPAAGATSVQRITVEFKDAAITDVLKKVGHEAGYNVFYNERMLKNAVPVTVKARNELFTDVLDRCFEKQPFSYGIVNKLIVVKEKEARSGEQKADPRNVAPLKREIKGKIVDENNSALPGASVLLKGTTVGTAADQNGEFSFESPEDSGVLVVSFIGYVTKEVPFSGESVLEVKLEPQDNLVEEIVVIGYGAIKRKNVTGAISSVKMEGINTSANTNFAQALAGRAPGVSAVQTSGQPGAGVSIEIRSSPSNASQGALYVIDGVIVNDNAGEPESGTRYGGTGISRSPLNFINPNDIETIDFLKDAAATAIYGARAGGGVVLITTKKGKSGQPSVQYDFSHSFQNAGKYYEVLDTKEYMTERNKILREKWMADNKIAPYGNVDPSVVNPFVPKYTEQQIASQEVMPNALDAVMQSGFTQQHNVSMSGTSNKTRYYVSGNYMKQDGVIKHSNYKRFSGRINLEQGIGEKVKAGVNLMATGSRADNGNIGDGLYENAGMLNAAFYYPATMPFRDAVGNYPINPDYQNTPNPLSFLEITDFTKDNRLLTSGFVEWKIIEGLTARGSLSYDQGTSKRNIYLPKSFLYGARAEGQAAITERNSASQMREYTLNYTREIGTKGNLNAVIGHSYQLSDFDGLNLGNDHFATDNFLFYNIGLGTAQRPTVGSYRSPTQVWKSNFIRVIYEHDGKYFLSASVRRDGASNFAANKKWGTFPGLSLGWVISEESFMKDRTPVTFLKLRLGYGSVGNSNIGSSAFSYYQPDVNYVIGGARLPGVVLSQLANPNLTWETQTDLNAGIDFTLFRNRINGSFDYFNRTISNLLSRVPLFSDFPVSSIATNSGKTRSVGWDASVQTKNIIARGKGFSWNTTINFSHYNNTWVERSPEALRSLSKFVGVKDSYNAWYGYLSDGIYDPAKMSAPEWMPGIVPGEVIIKDVNGYDDSGNLTGRPDGKLNTADKVLVHKNNDPTGNGKPVTNFSFGFNNEFTFQNFDLSVYMYGFIQKKMNRDRATAFDTWAQLAQFGWNVSTIAKDRWSYDNTGASLPTGLNKNYASFLGESDYWLENATFLRCREISLGYRLASELLGKQDVVKNLRVFASLQNPFVLTGYKGIDPELRNFLAYPMARSFTLGASVGF